MKTSRAANALLVGVVLLLVVTLGVLATLQYRWIDRVSEAEREQMRSNLDFAARRFAHDLNRELETLSAAFFRPDGGDAWARYDEWSRRTEEPQLIETIHEVRFEDEMWKLRQLDLETGELREVEWPQSLERIRRMVSRIDAVDPGDPRRWPPPIIEEIPAIFVAQRRGPPPGDDRPRFDEPPRFEFRDQPNPIVVTLSRRHLAASLFPRLAERHFSSSGADEYDVAVLVRDEVLYRSDAAWPDGKTAPDITLPLSLDPRGRVRGSRGPLGMGLRRRDTEAIGPEASHWRLAVRRHAGGLDSVVASARRRNLAISFGILLILGATSIVLLALLRRADRLRAQQTEFVAAITHELNTPVAALRTAGENLKDGIVSDREKVVRYGETIVKESSRLAEMIGQVLDFAGMAARPILRTRESIDVASIVDEAIARSRTLVGASSLEIDVTIDSGLPPVSGDSESLTRAVQNLITNAIRYGGSGKWIGVRARRESRGVAIAVEDRGPGIDSGDAAQLFEPFFRGRTTEGVRGSGLGLAIVRQIARAHGGSVDFDRHRPKGAAFTIHLPTAVERA